MGGIGSILAVLTGTRDACTSLATRTGRAGRGGARHAGKFCFASRAIADPFAGPMIDRALAHRGGWHAEPAYSSGIRKPCAWIQSVEAHLMPLRTANARWTAAGAAARQSSCMFAHRIALPF